jgi:predicted O-methyltransferase YrrM
VLDTESSPLRTVYLRVVRSVRRALDGSSVLRAWDRSAARRPRSTVAHLRTLLAVHNAEDLVALDLPWWTYEAVDTVDKFLADRGGAARVFEFGSGASTVWLARRAARVDAVEHHPEWAERVRHLLGRAEGVTAAVRLHVPPVPHQVDPAVPSVSPAARHLDFSRYVSTIDEVGQGPFDLVLVDGRARAESLRRALGRVSDNGMILLDDAQRPRYRDVLTEAAARGWDVTVTRGLTPCQPLPRETAILRRRPAPGP